MRAQTELPIPPKRAEQPPHLFGSGLRDRILMTLAANLRPLYVTELAEALGSDASKVRKALHVLMRTDVIADAMPRDNLRYVALNAASPAYLPLLRFLRVLETRWPQPRLGKPARTAERIALRGLRVVGSPKLKNIDNLFCSPGRTRVLLTIAAMGATDVSDLHATLGFESRGLWNVVNHWQREGVIRSRLDGRRRVLELDPAYPAAAELRRLLRHLVRLNEEYAALASLSTRLPDSPRFVALR